jgi:tetratricopeptide (TPR) repeat protein
MVGVLDQGHALANPDGIKLFEQEKYKQAILLFTKELNRRPDNPTINYYLGRSFLVLNQADKAINYLKKAAKLSPNIPDYQFWLGVGYWANMEFDKERRSYRDALKLNPDHFKANLYLGHNYMDRNQWKAALNQYDRALVISPNAPDALYNRALIFKQLERKTDEINAWISYLNHYRFGKWALQAAEYLNSYGKFSFRIFLLGVREIVVPAINFKPTSSVLRTDSLPGLEIISDILGDRQEISLHVIAYVKDNPNLAKSRAKALKNTILKMSSKVESSQIMLSWFSVPEKIDTKNGAYILDESIDIITAYK